jgi:hypothetical protein
MLNWVNPGDVMAWLLLVLLSTALSTGTAMMLLARSWNYRKTIVGDSNYSGLILSTHTSTSSAPASYFARPTSWLAVKASNIMAVQTAMGLQKTATSSWPEDLRGGRVFIMPPVNGWVLVMGPGLPEPEDDIDECFRWIIGLSRKLGQVQYFSADPVVYHHAWVRAERGRIVRAYAWAGKTLWKQGLRTTAEKDLAFHCPDYCEPVENAGSHDDNVESNVEKVPMLAARWSVDPAAIDAWRLRDFKGITGEPTRSF